MPTHVAFLRGMNLGKRRIKNEELHSLFEDLGFAEVASFRASGNVVFATEPKSSEKALMEQIEAGLGDSLGYEVQVFLRSCAEVREIAAQEPFDAKAVGKSGGKLQVSLLAGKPTAKTKREVLSLATDDDLLAVEGRELYWLPSGGILDSKLDLKAIDALLGPDTRRTMGTIEQIAAKHCD
ncbi:MAG TPA: DUF1697 domain-containing protein [Solirubrobacterales bacterium]|nr:DUF1697 domain-containing protein [Solirubrobacterales bacterium]